MHIGSWFRFSVPFARDGMWLTPIYSGTLTRIHLKRKHFFTLRVIAWMIGNGEASFQQVQLLSSQPRQCLSFPYLKFSSKENGRFLYSSFSNSPSQQNAAPSRKTFQSRNQRQDSLNHHELLYFCLTRLHACANRIACSLVMLASLQIPNRSIFNSIR